VNDSLGILLDGWLLGRLCSAMLGRGLRMLGRKCLVLIGIVGSCAWQFVSVMDLYRSLCPWGDWEFFIYVGRVVIVVWLGV
jgi:hypothetical protein